MCEAISYKVGDCFVASVLIIETHRDNFTISTDPSRLDNDAIAEMLKRSYWASGRPRERLDRALANSLVFGIYDGDKQIGLARSLAITQSSPTCATSLSMKIIVLMVSANG